MTQRVEFGTDNCGVACEQAFTIRKASRLVLLHICLLELAVNSLLVPCKLGSRS